MATKEEMLALAAQRRLQGASPVADTMHWIGEAGDDAKRLANMAARKIAMTNQGMEQDASRWDTMHAPAAMAQYQGPPAPMTVGGMARDMMDPAHFPLRPAGSIAEAVQQAGALVPGGVPEGWVKGKFPFKNPDDLSGKETFPDIYRWRSPDKTGYASITQHPGGRHAAFYHKYVPGRDQILEYNHDMPNMAAASEFIQKLLDQHHPE